MGNIIFDCDKENIITGQEVSIPINKKPNLIRDENKMKKFINLIFQYLYFFVRKNAIGQNAHMESSEN